MVLLLPILFIILPHMEAKDYVQIVALILALVAGALGLFQQVDKTDARLGAAREKADRQIESLVETGRRTDERVVTSELRKEAPPKPDYFDRLVAINLSSLAAYYDLVQVQTSRSFLASIWVGIVGVVLILVGLAVGFTSQGKSETVSYIATGAGVLTQFISGVFFYLYNQTVKELRGYHDSLVQVQNVLLCYKIIGETQDDARKAEMLSRLLGFLVGGTAAPATTGEPEKAKTGTT